MTLLAAPGGPLEGTGEALPRTGDLRVLATGGWQLLVAERMARFSRGVSARLPGLRTEGEGLLLDLTFDRATFTPGTRFTRLSGEAPASVHDAAGRSVEAVEFGAPAGAIYSVGRHEVNLR